MPKNLSLKVEILRQNLTQYEVARRAKIIPPRLSEIVCGWRVPSETEKTAIAEALGVPQEAIFPKDAA